MSALRSTGLWVGAAAVVAASGAARVPDGGGVAHAASASVTATTAVKKLPPGQPSGDLVATVPVASFGPADAAPQVLVAGQTYPIVVTVWVAATSGPAVVDVIASSGRLVGTMRTRVRAGVTRLRYALVVAPGSTRLTIAVNARTHDGGVVTRAFNHSIRSPYGSNL